MDECRHVVRVPDPFTELFLVVVVTGTDRSHGVLDEAAGQDDEVDRVGNYLDELWILERTVDQAQPRGQEVQVQVELAILRFRFSFFVAFLLLLARLLRKQVCG